MKSLRQEIIFGTETISYEVRFIATRHTLGIEVHPDLSVMVRAPADCSMDIIREKIEKRASWICKQLAEFKRYTPRTPARQYISGETHLYLGRQCRLKIVPGESSSVKMSRGQLLVTLPNEWGPERVKTLLHRWYLDRARLVFIDVLQELLPRFKQHQQPRLIVRSMQSRWGSLSSNGTMTLNANLVRAPRPCIEYVVTHELCHLRYRDHDTDFFHLLGQVMPDWEKRKYRLETALL